MHETHNGSVHVITNVYPPHLDHTWSTEEIRVQTENNQIRVDKGKLKVHLSISPTAFKDHPVALVPRLSVSH